MICTYCASGADLRARTRAYAIQASLTPEAIGVAMTARQVAEVIHVDRGAIKLTLLPLRPGDHQAVQVATDLHGLCKGCDCQCLVTL